MAKVGIYVGGDMQYEFEPADKGDDWLLTPQRNRRPISPGGAELREGKKVLGHIERVTGKGINWLIVYKPVPEPKAKTKKVPKFTRKRRAKSTSPDSASAPPESDISPVSEDES